jgi:hypothetical protein
VVAGPDKKSSKKKRLYIILGEYWVKYATSCSLDVLYHVESLPRFEVGRV